MIRSAFRVAATSISLILLVALGLRLGYAWSQEREIPANLAGSVHFMNETGNIADSLAQGKGFSGVFRQNTGPTAWLAPVYPLLVAGIFRIFGIFTAGSFYAVVLLNCLFSATVCVPLFRAGKRIGGTGVGGAAAWLWAIFPSAIVIPYGWVWDTSVSAFLGATVLWAALELAERRRLRDWCGYGALWGITLMTDPSLASLLPLLLGWVVYRHRGRGLERYRRGAVAAIVVILCCTPWTIRNAIRFHRFVPLRSDFPFELWLGNNEVLDPNSHDPMARITRYEEVRTYSQLGENAFLQRKWQLATEFMWTHPGLEVWLSERRFVAFWIGTATPVRTFLNSGSLLIRAVVLSNLLVVIGVVVGIAVLIRTSSAYVFPLAIFPIVYPCVYYVTHASLRYRQPIDPALLLLTAIAAASIWPTVFGHRGDPVGFRSSNPVSPA